MQNKYKQTFSLQKCYEHLTLIESFLSLKVQSSTQLANLFLCLQAVLSFPKQIEYLKHYKLHLTKFFGLQEAQKTIEDSFIVISAGSNDFIQNYYIYDNRSKEFTEPQYQDYLVARMSKYIKVCHPTFLTVQDLLDVIYAPKFDKEIRLRLEFGSDFKSNISYEILTIHTHWIPNS